MATAGDGRARYESGGAREKSGKESFRPGINEGLQNVSREAGRNNSTGVSDEGVEQKWKQKTLTGSEIQHPETMENVARDILPNIFIHLFAKQLAQMRCVSKYWNALLSHSSFVKSHLHHSINNKDRIFLVFYNEASPSYPIPVTIHPFQSPHLKLTNFLKLPPVDPKSGHTTSSIRVIGSVNGLICSRYGDDVIHIWNPSLSAVSTLPPYSVPSCCGRSSFTFHFGFDPKTNDYKVIKLIDLTDIIPYLFEDIPQIEVYSMRKGSWKFITQRFPSHAKYSVCVDGLDGHLHWHGLMNEERDGETIVAFDLGSETFHEIPFPISVLDGERWNKFGVLGGKLCVMSSWVITNAVYEVWVMDEYGVVESWVKRYGFSRLIYGVYAFTSHCEFLLIDDHLRLRLYDTTARKAKKLETLCRGNYSVDRFVEYVDSLVWVEPAKCEMVDGA